MRIRTIYGVLVSLLLIAFLLPSTFAMSPSGGQPASPSPDKNCGSAIATTYKTMNKTIAIDNALHSVEYRQEAQGPSNGTFASIFQIAKTTVPYPVCSEEVLSYNVVFILLNATGGFRGYLVITENRDLGVLGSSLQTQYARATNHSPIWGGYETQANSGATQTINGAYVDWTQPAAQYPTSGGCGAYGACNIFSWVGLADQSLAGNGHLDQAGTWADCVTSGLTCTDTYLAWYQVVDQGGNLIKCTSSTGGNVVISPGDSMYAETLNEAAYGGSNSKYDFTIDDTTSGTNCYSAGNINASMSSPVYGEFMVENGEVCGSGGSPCEPLAAFGTVPFQSSHILTAGSWSSINNFIFGAYDMANQNGAWPFCYGSFLTNVSYGSLNSNGDFTMTYQSNQYTPYWSSHC